MGDSAIKEANRIINLYDPPKDLRDGNFLRNDIHGPAIKKMLYDIFGMGKELPADLPGIGDRKEKIADSVSAFHGTTLSIVRPKHTSGHDARPYGLYMAQDNGPLDIVSEPKLIITPGSIVDPAGKTKRGAENLIKRYPVLPYSNSVSLSINDAISGDIEVEVEEKEKFYVFKIPVILNGEKETLSCSFYSKSYRPSGPNSKYFQGNITKNKFISENIGNTLECKKFILMKELGDTLQVEWLNTIFAEDPLIKRENTVIGTTDTVVKLRAAVNRIGSIHTTAAGKTTWMTAGNLDAASIAIINKTFIDKMRIEVISHNKSIIEILRDIVEKPVAANIWINGQTWKPLSISNAKKVLEKYIPILEARNKDINVLISGLNDIEAAKDICARTHFSSPFVQKKDGTYYTINSTSSFLPGIVFRAARFSHSSFDRPEMNVYPAVMSGGVRREICAIAIGLAAGVRGSFFRRAISAPEIFAIIGREVVEDVSNTESVNSMRNLRFIGGAEPDNTEIEIKVAKERTKRLQPLELAEDVFLSNGVNIESYEFLYCYIKEFHIEIFTYAYFMKLGLSKSRDMSEYASVDKNYGSLYYNEEGTYEWNENNAFIRNIEYDLPTKKNILKTTKQAIKLAYILTNKIPSLLTPSLGSFLNQVSALDLPKTKEVSDDELLAMLSSEDSSPFQGGGGKAEEELTNATTVAIDLYELYYSLLIKSSYEDKDTIDDYIVERARTFEEYYKNLEAPDSLLEFELELLYKEAENLPLVKAHMEQALEIYTDAIKPPSKTPKKTSKTPVHGGKRRATKKATKKGKAKAKRTTRKGSRK
jgi:hypothetical protein